MHSKYLIVAHSAVCHICSTEEVYSSKSQKFEFTMVGKTATARKVRLHSSVSMTLTLSLFILNFLFPSLPQASNRNQCKKKAITKKTTKVNVNKAEHAEALSQVSSIDIKRLMSEKMSGLNKVVVLKADGSQEELSVDMTPAEKACHKILGSDHLTFLGCICKGSVVMLIRGGKRTI